MWTIGIKFEFEAAHQFTKVPKGHKCKRLHGHNYIIEVEARSGTLDERDFVVDYFDLKIIKDYINEFWDHQFLNEVVGFETTVENLSKFLFANFHDEIPQLSAITIYETPTTFCRYEE